jgi:hypothetical protein
MYLVQGNIFLHLNWPEAGVMAFTKAQLIKLDLFNDDWLSIYLVMIGFRRYCLYYLVAFHFCEQCKAFESLKQNLKTTAWGWEETWTDFSYSWALPLLAIWYSSTTNWFFLHVFAIIQYLIQLSSGANKSSSMQLLAISIKYMTFKH